MSVLNTVLDRDLVVFDLETTGVNVEEDRIVQIAAIRLQPDGFKSDELLTLVYPQRPIPPDATEIHGITDADVEAMPTFSHISNRVFTIFHQADVAGYNILGFDLPLLRAEFARCGRKLPMDGRRFFDAFQIFCHFFKRDLAGALRFYCDSEQVDAHDAMGDVCSTLNVMTAQLQRHEELTSIDEISKLCMGDRVTLDGKLIRNEDGEVCLGFGKHKGTPLKRANVGYLKWICGAKFSGEVKALCWKALSGEL